MRERIESNVAKCPVTGCWFWLGAIRNGYGVISVNDKAKSVHRVAYGVFRESIPAGLHIDHKCRQRSCCNPDHLEVVTAKQNVLRGEGLSANNARKTHCKRGHALAGENLLRRNGVRNCRLCRNRMQQQRKERDRRFYNEGYQDGLQAARNGVTC